MKTLLSGLVRIVAVAAVALWCVAVGYIAVSVPDLPTEALSQAFSPAESSPFSKDDLVRAAVVGKQYTFNAHDKQALYDQIAAMNARAAAEGDQGAVADAGFPDVDAMERAFAEADERYVLTPDAMSHLDDVWPIAVAGYVAFGASTVLALAGLVFCGATGGRRRVGGVLIGAGAVVLVAFAALGVWAVVDFDGLFAAFHALFFAAGTWTFSRDSLLITMYPPEFWVGMGAIWLVTTCLAAILSIGIGAILRRKAPAS
ncbi:DUF1461 domain-containing protein [Eggerthellaceae bacterium zg-893]|nr:DUF1461 domain-containing protein [Eggerthellaceae bacterium zg-893]